MLRKTLLVASVCLTAASALVLTGCTPGGSATTSKSASASKDLGTSKVTLTLMSTPDSGAATKATIASFEKKYPNIKVKYSQTNYTDYNKSVNLDLQSNESPDIALLNSVANTVKDKLVLDLDPYAKIYNWTTSFPSNELDQWRVEKDGTTLGDGSLYASPAGFSLVGVYYNKTIAQKLGITSTPNSIADLEADMAIAKKAGQLPLQLGDADGAASFIVQSVSQSIQGPKATNAWAYGHAGETFVNASNGTGADTLVKWVKAGYTPNATTINGTTAQQALGNFLKGQGLFYVDGIWDAGTIAKGLGAAAGFAAFPGAQPTGIGTSVAYAISAKSKHPNQAAAFLNYLQSAAAGKQQFAEGFMPDDPASANPSPNTVQADIVAAWGKVSAANGLVAFNNNATATMETTLTSSTQELIAGRATTAQFLAAIQTDWATTHAK